MKDDTLEQEKAHSLAEMVIRFLRQNPGYEYTAGRIAEWISVNYPRWCAEKRLRSKVNLDSDEKLIAQVANEIPSRRSSIQEKDPKINIKKEPGNSLKYYYTDKSDIKESGSAEGRPPVPTGFKKRDEELLYPVLCKFLLTELKVYSKRLNHLGSSKEKKGIDKWLHPDLVGIQNLSEGWRSEIKDCVEQRADKRGNLWSFELKAKVYGSSMREDFFQAVSNSSWANFGYLVAGEIEDEDETLPRLRILSGLHGIGVIDLNPKNSRYKKNKGQIIIPAKERSEIDWDASNILAKNPDFRGYLELVHEFYKGGSINPDKWDYKPRKK